jgi:transposase
MAYPKLKTTKRDVTAKELAKRFGCSTRTVFRAWSQSRARDYLAENSISRDKPWEHFGISRATWYRRGKPMPSETDNQSETA